MINYQPVGTVAAPTGFARSQSPRPWLRAGCSGGWKARLFGGLGGGMGPGGAAFSSLTVGNCGLQRNV